MARRYNRDSRGRFASGGGGGGSRRPAPRGISRGINRLTRDNSGRITSVGGDGATARGGRLRTASGKQRGTQTARISGGRAAGTVTRSGARRTAAAKPTAVSKRQESLRKGAERNNARADKIDAKVKALETEYRSKGSNFYTQPVKTRERDRMHEKMQQAVKLRDEAASLRQKARNANRMADRIKPPAPPKSSNGNSRMERAIRNEAAGSTSFRRNPKGYQKRITALAAQKIYKTGDITGELSLQQRVGRGFRLPRNQRPTATNPTTRAAAAAVKPARKSIGSISEAKASRIIARLDANRSGIRRATGTARQTANSIRTRERAVAFALAPGARARKKGQNISTNESLQRAVKNASKNRAAKAATSKSTAAAAAKPAKGSAAAQKIEQAKGRTKVLTQSKNALNQQLKAINAQIKQAGPSAGGLRLQKLQIQDRLSQLRRDIAASKAAARG